MISTTRSRAFVDPNQKNESANFAINAKKKIWDERNEKISMLYPNDKRMPEVWFQILNGICNRLGNRNDSEKWYTGRDSNPQPSDPKSDALSSCATGALEGETTMTLAINKVNPVLSISIFEFIRLWVVSALPCGIFRLWAAICESCIFITLLKYTQLPFPGHLP